MLIASIATQNYAIAAVAFAGLGFSTGTFKMTGFAMVNLDIVGACEAIRREASDLAGENYAYNLKKKTGMLDFITSPENTSVGGVETSLISYDAGTKIARGKVLYDQRSKSCQVGTDCDVSICDDGSTPARKQFFIEIDRCIHTPIRQYANEEMIALCKDTQTFLRERALSDLNAAREKLGQLLMAEADNQVGVNYEWDGTTTAAGSYKDIQLLTTASGQRIPLPGNYAEVVKDYGNNQLAGLPAIIGEGNFGMFATLHGMSCCNSTTPYGDSALPGARYYEDQSANEVLGANRFIAATYGALRLQTFNVNKGIGIQQADKAHIVVPDPMGYPFSWDLDMLFDSCTKTWKILYSLRWTMFNVFQEDSFSANDGLESPDISPDCADELIGMLGVFGYRATQA